MTLTPKPGRTGNRLLDRLPEEDLLRLAPQLEIMTLDCKHALYQVDEPLTQVYFPRTGVISLVIVLKDGRQVEVATVGNEGVVGLPVLHGIDASPYAVTCQVPGQGWRLPARAFVQAAENGSRLGAVLKRYAAVRERQASQVIACNALHPVEERMSRWLLMTHDRVEADEFPLTQEYLAEMLGVRRQTVTVVAGMLQKSGLISYRRGVIHILDRPGLQGSSCECYEAMKVFYERLMA